jgi:hypothetical protein
MGKPRMIGQFKPYIPNSRADMRRMKVYSRNREYTDRHEDVMAVKREERQIRENEQRKYGKI